MLKGSVRAHAGRPVWLARVSLVGLGPPGRESGMDCVVCGSAAVAEESSGGGAAAYESRILALRRARCELRKPHRSGRADTKRISLGRCDDRGRGLQPSG
jgi:hypothetical protein